MIRHLGLIGDVHGQEHALIAVLDFLGSLSFDVLLCTGDLPIKGYTQSVEIAQTTNRCARLLQKANVLTVRGNHDRYFVENASDPALAQLFHAEWEASAEALRFARSLPVTRRFDTPRGELLLCHGFGRDDTAGIYPGGEEAPIADALEKCGMTRDGIRYVVAGHTHRRMQRIVAGITLINPGSLVGDKEPPGFAVADLESGIVTFYRLDEMLRIHSVIE